MLLHLNVTGITGLGNARPIQARLCCLRPDDAVTVNASNAASLMNTAFPKHLFDVLGMTGAHALGVLHRDRLGALPKRDHSLCGTTSHINVRAPWAMTRLTDPLLLGGTRVHRHDPPHCCLEEALARLPMALQAGVSPNVLSIRWGTSPRRLGRIACCRGRRLRHEFFSS